MVELGGAGDRISMYELKFNYDKRWMDKMQRIIKSIFTIIIQKLDWEILAYIEVEKVEIEFDGYRFAEVRDSSKFLNFGGKV